MGSHDDFFFWRGVGGSEHDLRMAEEKKGRFDVQKQIIIFPFCLG